MQTPLRKTYDNPEHHDFNEYNGKCVCDICNCSITMHIQANTTDVQNQAIVSKHKQPTISSINLIT